MSNKDENNAGILRNLALVSQIGISMLTPILLGIFIGIKIDKWVGTESLFTIVFIVIGIGASFTNLFKLTDTKEKEKRK